jgi:hypothetical protein
VLLVVVGVLVTALLFYTLAKSKPLADFLDSVSDTELSARAKLRAFFNVWKKASSDHVRRMQADVELIAAEKSL